MKMHLHWMANVMLFVSALCLYTNTTLAKTDLQKTSSVTQVDRVSITTKHKILQDKTQDIVGEASQIESDTQKAIVALDNKDPKDALVILKGVSGKLDNLLAKNPGLDLLPASVETDVFDFIGDKQTIAKAIDEAGGVLKQGKLQDARQILSGLASEIRVSTTSIPLGTFPSAIKKVIPLIESGKRDQAAADLNAVLDTLVVTTEIMPLPVLRAEELLTVAAEFEHRDDLSKEQNRAEIARFTDAAKDQLELAQLLGYGGKDDYKVLYKEIDAIHKVLFTEKSASAWQKVKDEFAQFKDRLKALSEAAERIGHPAK